MHEAIDRVKALEARTRQAQREAVEGMVAAHAEHEAQLARIGKAIEKEAELNRRTERAKARASEAEAAAARAFERARQAGEGTHAEGVAACSRAVHALLQASGAGIG